MGFKEEHINKVLVKHGPNLSYHEGVAALNKLKNAEEEMDTSNEANYSPIKGNCVLVFLVTKLQEFAVFCKSRFNCFMTELFQCK